MRKANLNNHGFTLIELMITMTIFTIMLSYASLSFIQKRHTVGADKTAQEINMIQAAAKKYYMDYYQTNSTGDYPSSLSDLQNNNYLGTNFPSNNPFGYSYSCSKIDTGTNKLFQIETRVPTPDVARQIASKVPGAQYVTLSGNPYVRVTINPPGTEASLDNLLHRDAASTNEQRTMYGNLLLANGVTLEDLDASKNPTGYQIDPDGVNILNDFQSGGTGGNGVLYVSSVNKKVGINTGGLTNAQEALHVVGNVKVNRDGDSTLNDEYFQVTVTNTDTKLFTDRNKLYIGGTANNILTVDTTNNRVGINNTNPNYTVDVTGNIKWGTDPNSKGLLSTDQGASLELGGTGTPYIDFANDGTTDYDVRIQLTGDDELSINGGQLNLAYNRTRISRFDGSNTHWFRYSQTNDSDLMFGIHRNAANDYDLYLKGGHSYRTNSVNITFGRAANGSVLNLKKGLIMQQSVVRDSQTVAKPNCPNGTNPYIFVTPASINTNGYPITGISAYAVSVSSSYWRVYVRAWYWNGNSTNNLSTNNTAIVETRCL
ncbi:hypothetical protein DEFDS_P254 (plasmid) [Deferribacter desulfuricans SSM1]|uniref:Prepilin-type N-terminal cleavage/methylation domain-containing protein n=1 Tax=Deferribacter desulfuricans (strain DSM 14783 / JCM 11476 / NBRC 101012 / SSM1) TaxID=639282 RepID=D3PF82_DEFDS|nr:type II secretion system protein [Deferribacter desulfuricans]BAI81874.1 hypothetical protein DEFDS_P254 [Deferribacter desulfuricans SSM1]